jgi:TctA family transporter
VIRAYVPWYLVRNYLAFAFVACLAALQLAQARGRRHRLAALLVLIAAFLGFYALAPELLTPGPAGGEMTFLFGGAALAAVMVTRVLSRIIRFGHSKPPQSGGEESLPRSTETLRRDAAEGDKLFPYMFSVKPQPTRAEPVSEALHRIVAA